MQFSGGWHPSNLEKRILELWFAGLDTLDIALKVGRPEYEVFNRLWHLRNGS